MKEEVRLSSQAKLAKETNIEMPVTLYGTATVKKDCKIGAYTFINSNTTVYPGTIIGRYCSIGKNCEVAAFDHPLDWLSTSPFQYNMKLHFPEHEGECHQIKPIRPEVTTIGNDVWISASCIIKRGITIGDGAIIAGGAVAIYDVPPYAIIGGVPGKILKYRFDEKTIKKLMALKWWELKPEALDGIQFNNIHEAIRQLEILRNIPQKLEEPTRQRNISELQKSIDASIVKSQESEPLMTFEEIEEIISSQLLEADIEAEIIEEIMLKNKDMNRDYDKDEHLDQVILNHKIAAVIEIVLTDNEYCENKIVSTQGHKKIMNVLRDKQ